MNPVARINIARAALCLYLLGMMLMQWPAPAMAGQKSCQMCEAAHKAGLQCLCCVEDAPAARGDEAPCVISGCGRADGLPGTLAQAEAPSMTEPIWSWLHHGSLLGWPESSEVRLSSPYIPLIPKPPSGGTAALAA